MILSVDTSSYPLGATDFQVTILSEEVGSCEFNGAVIQFRYTTGLN